MTKDKYMYELIDQCMVVSCQDIILMENFELSDNWYYYREMEKQFKDCLKFYDQMKALLVAGKIDEEMMEQELRTVLAMVRQKALAGLLEDFRIFLEDTDISEDERKKQMDILRKELQSKNADTEYLLKKIIFFRAME